MIEILNLEYRIGGYALVENPLGHLGACIGLNGPVGVPAGQLAVGVKKISVEFKTYQIAFLGGQGPVVTGRIYQAVLTERSLKEEIVVVVQFWGILIADLQSSVNGVDLASGENITVEHAVHDHGADIGGLGCKTVVSYYTSFHGTARYAAETVAVDYA